MKKVLLLVLCAALAGVLLVGCGSSGDDTTDTGGSEMMYTIGISQFAPHPALDNTREGFLAGLADAGIVEGENLTVKFEDSQGDFGTAQQIAQNFVSQNVDLIYAIATPSAQAAQNAAEESGIPVVYGAITDPIKAQLANEDKSGNGNITGVSDKLPAEPQLKMIRELLPDATTIGIIYNTGEDNSLSTMDELSGMVEEYGFTIEEVGVTAMGEVAGATDALLAKNVDCFYVITDNTVVSALDTILDKTDEAKVPVFGSEVEQVKKGAVATEGIEYFALGKRAGQMAAQILKDGKAASDIDFVYFTEFYPYINTAAADLLGLEIPQAMLNGALEVFDKLDR
jgi:putative ABC transport system substrate-binding protein